MLPKVNKKIFAFNLIIAFGLIYIGLMLYVQHLQGEVAERLHAQVVLRGTEGTGLKIDTVGDKAPWVLGAETGLNAINDALEVYPPWFLKVYGPNVLLSNKLTLEGVPVGGTVTVQYPKSWVVLEAHYFFSTYESVRLTFHHEFSSILIGLAPFPYTDWEAAIPTDFSFPPLTEQEIVKGLKDLRENRPGKDDMPAIYAQGFVDAYGRTTEENDINTYAELLMDKPDELALLASQYPLIAKKAALLKDFYLSLDPGFQQSPFAQYDYAAMARQ